MEFFQPLVSRIDYRQNLGMDFCLRLFEKTEIMAFAVGERRANNPLAALIDNDLAL